LFSPLVNFGFLGMEADEHRCKDISSTQPPRPNRPAHNGRLRSCRTHPLLLPLWHFSPLLRQGPFRIHIRPCAARRYLPAPNPLTHVTSLKPLRITLLCYSRPHIRSSLPKLLFTPLLDLNVSKECVRAGILFTAFSDDEFSGGRTADGWHGGVCVDESGDCVVHL
jgi:hypothetical protein